MPGESSLEFFERTIIKNIQPLIYKGDPEKSPAIAVGLVTSQGEVSVALGNREIQRNLPPDGDTLFAIGSITKVFTGLILAKAFVDGDMDLSSKTNDWLRKKMQIDDRITLKQLVTHYSGLPSYPDNIAERNNVSKNPKIRRFMPANDYSRANLENCLKNVNCQPQTPPGKKYLYSNFGIGLLSIALQNRYRYKDFNELNQAKITQVLNMHHTSTNIPSFLEKHKNNLAQGYQYHSDSHSLEPVPFSDMGILAGGGELISSTNDMILFLKMLTGLSKSPLEKAAEEVLTGERLGLHDTDKPRLKAGYAHDIRKAGDGGDVHFKAGLTPGYSALLIWRDNPKVGLILLSNRGKFRPMLPVSNHLLEVITHQLQN